MPTIADLRRVPGLMPLLGLLGVAVLVSVVHYVDNVANYADYPQPSSGPAPSRELIAVSWFVFTAFGIAGLGLFARRRFGPAAVALAVYSISGLVGLGHYTVPGATDMPWWRQLHVVADIAAGLAVLAFAVWALRRRSAQAATR
ncbi:MAG TPA: hypothetical protein VGR10_03375 [Thermoleophilaceae bacterium]|nr:hypothetical protein [Thermoleophilaceae bacterium]